MQRPALVMGLLAYLRRHLRFLAALTLMAWTSAFAAGVVNCGLVHSHEFGRHQSIASAPRSDSELNKDAGQSRQAQVGDHDLAVGSDGHGTDAGKDSCDRFCVDESSTVAKADTGQPDLIGLLRVTGADWQSPMPLPSASIRRSEQRRLSQGPPLFLRLLRLAN